MGRNGVNPGEGKRTHRHPNPRKVMLVFRNVCERRPREETQKAFVIAI